MRTNRRLFVSNVKSVIMITVFMITFVLPASGEWVKSGSNPIVTGIAPTGGPSVLEFGGMFHMWYINNFNIWHATSPDGLSWTPSGQVFGDGRQLWLGTVLRRSDGTYQMWYSWGGAIGQIGYATSSNGISWSDLGLVLGPTTAYDAYAAETPHVIYDDSASIYKMWYNAGASVSVGRTIAYATSSNGRNWTKHGVVFTGKAGTWYSYSVAAPYVEKTDTGYTMWFNGNSIPLAMSNSIGHAHSEDGVNWNYSTVTLDLVPGSAGSWDDWRIGGPYLLRTSTGQMLLYYEGQGFDPVGTNPIGIGVATPEPVITATIDIDPDTLSLSSKDKWVTCYIELPSGYEVMDIDGASVKLEGISAYIGTEGWAKAGANSGNIMDHDGDGILERMVKFDGAAVRSYLSGLGVSGYTGLTVTGDLIGGPSFEGIDVIKVIK